MRRNEIAAGDGEEPHHHEDEEPLFQRELDDSINHGNFAALVLKRIGELQKQTAVGSHFISGRKAF